MKKLIALLLLAISLTSSSDAMIRRRVLRMEEEIEFTNGRRIIHGQGIEIKLNRNGEYDRQEYDSSKSLASILYRNIVRSEAAHTGLLFLAGACIIGAESAACSSKPAPWNNQTQCPASYSATTQIPLSAKVAATLGVTLCGGKCVESAFECCCEYDPENEF